MKHKTTGETQELNLTIAQWDQWKKENVPLGWDRDWSVGCASAIEEGEWRDKLAKKHPSWNEYLGKLSNLPGSRVQKY